MQQIEVSSWKTLDALRNGSTQIHRTIGDLDTNEQMAVFCSLEDDFLELYYSELETNYIRHFDDEDDMHKHIENRKDEFGEEDFGSPEYYDDESDENDKGQDEDYSGYKIRNEDDGDDY